MVETVNHSIDKDKLKVATFLVVICQASALYNGIWFIKNNTLLEVWLHRHIDVIGTGEEDKVHE